MRISVAPSVKRSSASSESGADGLNIQSSPVLSGQVSCLYDMVIMGNRSLPNRMVGLLYKRLTSQEVPCPILLGKGLLLSVGLLVFDGGYDILPIETR